MEYIIETNQLTKIYHQKAAVNHVDLHVKKGDIYGFIGKNGAGKTTTMKLLLGLIFPTSGEMKLFESTNLNQARKKIGSLIEEPGLYANKTAYENLKLFSLAYGSDEKDILDILKLIGLENTGKRKAGDFSLGMRQRLGIGIALLNHPELLILDEPINGLDPSAIKEVRDCLLRINEERQVTIFISSHLLDELAKITTCYGIVQNGVLVEEISKDELITRCQNKLIIHVNDVHKAISLLEKQYPQMQYKVGDEALEIYSHLDQSSEINKLLVFNQIEVKELKFSTDGFEQYFIERIGS